MASQITVACGRGYALGGLTRPASLQGQEAHKQVSAAAMEPGWDQEPQATARVSTLAVGRRPDAMGPSLRTGILADIGHLPVAVRWLEIYVGGSW